MKTLLFLTLFISGATFAQTDVIATKSHSSNISSIEQKSDNFGGSFEQYQVYKVEYIGEECLVEMSKGGLNGWENRSDTICNHPFLKKGKMDANRIKRMYKDNVEFVGFDKLEVYKEEKKARVKKNKTKKDKSSVFILFLFGGALFLAYLFVPKQRVRELST